MELIRKTISSWIFLEFCFLPFNYAVIPTPGTLLHRALFPFVDPIYKWLGGSDIADPTLSDSASTYILAAVLIPFVLITVILIEKTFKKEIPVRFIDLLTLYFLAFFLLRYGLDKVLSNQFQTPEPNILNARVGDLSKDLLFWTSMGTSSVYNQFLGWTEVITGVALIIPKTNKLALYASCGIFLNVFFINLGFDISVKFLSAFLLFTSIWMLILKKHESSKGIFKQHYIAYAFALLLVSELIVSCMQVMQKQKPLFEGTYMIEASNSPILEQGVYLHFHSKGYVITEFKDVFTSYKLNVEGDKILLHIKGMKESLRGLKLNNRLRLTAPKDTIMAKRVNKNYLLLQDSTHWMVENF